MRLSCKVLILYGESEQTLVPAIKTFHRISLSVLDSLLYLSLFKHRLTFDILLDPL